MDARTFDESKLPSRHVMEGSSRAPHRSVGGPIAPARDGYMISIDAAEGRLDLEVSEAELTKRCGSWKSPANAYQSGVLRK
jgi:dihydroxy-acid dehydratase